MDEINTPLDIDLTFDIPSAFLEDKPDKYIALKVTGDNYYPYLFDGDKVLICRKLPPYNPFGIYLVNIEGNIELRRMIIKDNGSIVFAGLTPYIPPIIAEDRECEILGGLYLLIRKYYRESEKNVAEQGN